MNEGSCFEIAQSAFGRVDVGVSKKSERVSAEVDGGVALLPSKKALRVVECSRLGAFAAFWRL